MLLLPHKPFSKYQFLLFIIIIILVHISLLIFGVFLLMITGATLSMNENKVDYQGMIQQSHGLNGDMNSEFGNRYCHYFDIRQVLNIGTCNQQLSIAEGGKGEELQYINSSKSCNTSSTIMSRFESPTSAFYAAENCMKFAEFDSQVGNHCLEFPMYQSVKENNHLLDSPNLDLSNTLQAMVNSQLNSNLCLIRSSEKSNKLSYENFPIEQQKVFIDGGSSFSKSSSFCDKGNQDHPVVCGSYNLPVAQTSFSSEHDKLSSTISAGSVSTNFGNATSNGTVVSSKTRIRWTKDLHEKFVESVNRLGGAEKATPKSILRMMDSNGLTILHVKSHLQKYRTAKFMPDSGQGKSDTRIRKEGVHNLGVKTGLQIRETLQLQLDAQRRLHEQLEIQRRLQLRIEEQGRELKKMFDQQQKTCNNLLNTSITANDDTTIILKDVEVSTSEAVGNSLFHSKTSPSK